MAENTLKSVYKFISDALKKKKKAKIGLGKTPQAKAIAKHKKDLEDALKY